MEEKPMEGCIDVDDDENCDFVEVDPTRRYGRYDEILGKGACKTVYRGFDEYEGIEIAWNQVKLYDFLQRPDDLARLYCEVHLLKTLKHKNIMKLYTSWIDTEKRNINFVTEMFTSGTLKQYREKHKRVNIRAVKHWCRQILRGLFYLHSHEPPVIHRDLKCDNIFINGNYGEVKIGDLGLAATLRKSHEAHCVGTPEFMAPEVYEEEYNELVDIYSFGMCILELVTFEYPYSECTHPAQIYKKVISGKKPDALYKVKDPEVREFIEKCIVTVSQRLPAKELLKDPFLQIDSGGYSLGEEEGYLQETDETDPYLVENLFENHPSMSSFINGYSDDFDHDIEIEPNLIELFTYHEDDHYPHVDISIKGMRREDGGIFLRLRIADEDDRIRNIYFPFDVEMDTALIVATEMVAELDITDQDVTKIAHMIDEEIASLLPGWKSGLGTEENRSICYDCAPKRASNVSISDYTSLNNITCANDQQVLQCVGHRCAETHGRFEEITYQVEHIQFDQAFSLEDHNVVDKNVIDMVTLVEPNNGNLIRRLPSFTSLYITSPARSAFSDDYENEIRKELRWLKAKYETELQNQQLGEKSKGVEKPDVQYYPVCSSDYSEDMFTAKSFYGRSLRSHSSGEDFHSA